MCASCLPPTARPSEFLLQQRLAAAHIMLSDARFADRASAQ
jgi:hypothetical protein